MPANIRIPPSYLSMINVATPKESINWDRPLSRINRRKNLIEIGESPERFRSELGGLLRHWALVKMSSGFGKQETYQKGVILGEGTYAIVYEGKSSLTGNRVALKGKIVRYFIILELKLQKFDWILKKVLLAQQLEKYHYSGN